MRWSTVFNGMRGPKIDVAGGVRPLQHQFSGFFPPETVEPKKINLIDYNQISSMYDGVRKGDVTIINRFLGELPDHNMLNILDIGCGTGNYIDIFQRITRGHGFKFFGIDPSEGMLDKARQKNDCILFLLGTAECVPLDDNLREGIGISAQEVTYELAGPVDRRRRVAGSN